MCFSSTLIKEAATLEDTLGFNVLSNLNQSLDWTTGQSREVSPAKAAPKVVLEIHLLQTQLTADYMD